MTRVPRAAVATTAALLIADDDVPFSSGRRPGAPDDTELSSVRHPRPLRAGGR